MVDDSEENIDELLKFDIDSISDKVNELKEFNNNLKSAHNHYSNICHDAIVSLFKKGSNTEANDLRIRKRQKIKEINETLMYIKSLIADQGFSDAISLINSETSSNYEHSRLRHSLSNPELDLGTTVSDPKTTQTNPDLGISSETSSPDVPKSSYDFPEISNLSLKPSHSNGGRKIHIEPINSGPNVSQDLHSNSMINLSSATNPLTNVNQFSSVSPTVSYPTSIVTVTNSTSPLSTMTTNTFPVHSIVGTFSPPQSSLPAPLSSFNVANGSIPFPNPSAAAFPHSNIGMSSFGYSHFGNVSSPPLSVASPPHANFPPAGSPFTAVHNDSASFHLIKQQLFQPATDPFDGDPKRYNAWLSGLNNKTDGLNLSNLDKLLILKANTVKEPQRLVEDYISSGMNPSEALPQLLHELKKEFGSSVLIANSLNHQVNSFMPIKSTHQTDRLKELVRLCKYIEINMNNTEELTIFNTVEGIKKVWLKLPEPMQNQWLSISEEHISRYDRNPPFSAFVQFVSKKTREYSNPLYQRTQTVFDRKKDHGLKTTFVTHESPLKSQLRENR